MEILLRGVDEMVDHRVDADGTICHALRARFRQWHLTLQFLLDIIGLYNNESTKGALTGL